MARSGATDRAVDASGASITFKAPGYSADCLIDTATGIYRLTVDYQGAIGWLNDLHRGRDAGSAWGWLIDLAGLFLALISATGLGLLWYLKKVRVRAFITIVVGAAMVMMVATLFV